VNPARAPKTPTNTTQTPKSRDVMLWGGETDEKKEEKKSLPFLRGDLKRKKGSGMLGCREERRKGKQEPLGLGGKEKEC